MKIIYLLLLSLFVSSVYASELLDSKYNHIGFGFSSNFGDGEGTTSSIAGSFKPESIPFLISYAYADADIDEILGLSVNGLDSNANQFTLGYVIESSSSLHIIPTISFGSSEVSFANVGRKADTTSLGVSFRSIANENTVFTFSLNYTSVDDASYSDSAKTIINNLLDDLGYNTLNDSEFNQFEDNLQGSDFSAAFGLEYHFAENVTLTYGITSNFDTTALGFGIGFNY